MFNPGVAVLMGLCGLCLGIVFMALFATTKERSGYNKN
jgi:hypothetical protein